PFNETINFEWSATSESVNLEVIDQYGSTILHSTAPTGKSGVYYITLESSALPKGMYYYRLTADGKTYTGKISKR
ncbi:MAG: T9SS type A sorting domain-containing protein, partial [Cyclobacteriaceae bacterium]